MSFIADALQLIFDQTSVGQHPKPHVRRLNHREQVVTVNGESVTELLRAPSFDREATSLESFAAQLMAFNAVAQAAYVSHDEVKAVLDDAERDEFLYLFPKPSEAYSKLDRLAAGVSQAELVRELRTSLAGAVSHDELLSVIREIQFDTQARTNAKATRQAESMGRSVEREVRAGAGEIPERVTLSINRFACPVDFNSKIHVECAVNLDLQKETIALIPVDDCLATETARVVSEMAEKLAAACSPVPVFAGVFRKAPVGRQLES